MRTYTVDFVDVVRVDPTSCYRNAQTTYTYSSRTCKRFHTRRCGAAAGPIQHQVSDPVAQCIADIARSQGKRKADNRQFNRKVH